MFSNLYVYPKKGKLHSDQDLADTLFNKPNYAKDYLAHVKDCTKNLPDDLAILFSSPCNDTDYQKMVARCKATLSLLPPTNIPRFVAALVQIIKYDESIKDQCTIGVNRRYIKTSILSSEKFLPEDFLANVMIYVCTNNDNPNGKGSIAELTSEYMDTSLRCNSYIKIVDSIENLNEEKENFTSPDRFEQNNYGKIIINNHANMNYIEYVENINFN